MLDFLFHVQMQPLYMSTGHTILIELCFLVERDTHLKLTQAPKTLLISSFIFSTIIKRASFTSKNELHQSFELHA